MQPIHTDSFYMRRASWVSGAGVIGWTAAALLAHAQQWPGLMACAFVFASFCGFGFGLSRVLLRVAVAQDGGTR